MAEDDEAAKKAEEEKKKIEEEEAKKKAEEEEAKEKVDAEKKLADEKAEEDKKKVEDEAEAEAKKKEESQAEEVKTLQQAQVLLTKASSEIETLKSELKELKTGMESLKAKADKYTKLVEKEKLEAVDGLVKKKLSLGLVEEKDTEVQKEMLSKFEAKNIKLMTAELDKVKPGVVKESMKGVEGQANEESVTVKKLMAGAGFKKETIDNYGKEDWGDWIWQMKQREAKEVMLLL